MKKPTPKKDTLTPLDDEDLLRSDSKIAPRMYNDARPLDEHEGLPFTDIPRHLGVDTDDENELQEGYARAGAGDLGPTRDEEDLEADESQELEEYGV